MAKVNLTPMARALLKAGLPGKVPEAARVDLEPVPIIIKDPLPAWELPAEGVVTSSTSKVAEDLIRVCPSCGEDFKVIPQGDVLPRTCPSCSTGDRQP